MTAPVAARPRRNLRPGLVWAHRILGLTTAVFLALAGLTGSILAFYEEIDQALNPAAYAPSATGAPLSPEALARAVEAGAPDRAVWYMTLVDEDGAAALAVAMGRVDPATGEPRALDADWFNVDPVSGQILAQRLWGECCFGPLNFIPFIYEFHHNLSLPGTVGVVLMGVVAIIWLVDGFIGLALTFPRGRPFLAKWKPAFTIKGGSSFRLTLDLHRAFGLWLFALLIIIAITSISMNLRAEVMEPVVNLFSKVTATPLSEPPLPALRERTLSYDTVLDAGLREAEARGWREPPSEIFYSPHQGLFGVAFGDEHTGLGARWIYLSGDQAEVLDVMEPGAGTAGDIFLQAQLPIHSGRILGLPGRILIAVMGVVIAMLSVTGVIVWWKKRAGRVGRAAKASAATREPPSPHTLSRLRG